MTVRLCDPRAILIFLSAALLGGCRDTAGVLPGLSATYVLETVNGEALPSVAATGSTGQLVRLADTLVFSSNGNLDRHLTIRFVGQSITTPDTTIHDIQSLAYDIDGDRLTVRVRSCPDNAQCIGPSEGHIDARQIDLVDTGWNSATLHFTVR